MPIIYKESGTSAITPQEFNIDIIQLKKDIDAIPGVCKEGQKAIRRLFSNLFNIKFVESPVAIIGGIYINKDDRKCMLITMGNPKEFGFVYLNDANLIWIASVDETINSIQRGLWVKIANSLEEYTSLE